MHDIVKKLETLAKVERRISVKILRHLMEVEGGRIHLDMGYASLFVFLTKHLKYSDGSAYRRIEAMKILRDVPDLGQRITVGANGRSNQCYCSCGNFPHCENKEDKKSRRKISFGGAIFLEK